MDRNEEGLFGRLELLEIVRQSLRDEADWFRSPMLTADVKRIRQVLTAAETEINALNDSVPDAQYQSVTYRQPKLAAKIPEALWGQPLDGLRLALVPRQEAPIIDWNELPLDTPLSASVTVPPGSELGYQLVVENVSDQEIKLSGYLTSCSCRGM